MQEVEYRPVEGFEAYRVGRDGSVWTRWRKGPGATPDGRWKLMQPTLDRDGYRRIELHSLDGGRVTRKVCGLVCTAFWGKRPQGYECRHLDGKQANDAADNLAWGTPIQNHADKRQHGTIACGDRHGKTKLTAAQIAELLALKGTMTQQRAADHFGCSRGYVGQLWAGSRKRVAV